jgi:hypothetical protein
MGTRTKHSNLAEWLDRKCVWLDRRLRIGAGSRDDDRRTRGEDGDEDEDMVYRHDDDAWGVFSSDSLPTDTVGKVFQSCSISLAADTRLFSFKVASIPLSAILSIRSSSLSSSYLCPDPALSLATHVLHEFSLGTRSSFWGYLQSLPDPAPQLAAFWPETARKWTKGTELGRLLSNEWSLVRLCSYCLF